MTKPETLTIGAFAKASRLSPKALRLYDELDLLRPARVDPDTGYRYYAPEQLEQARLVAWLRRLGMPLARIRQVRAMEPAAAAQEIRAVPEAPSGISSPRSPTRTRPRSPSSRRRTPMGARTT
jgi:PPM family protein phosphatase